MAGVSRRLIDPASSSLKWGALAHQSQLLRKRTLPETSNIY
jgi:hypothetical protein